MRLVHAIGSMHPRTGGPPVVMTRLAAALAALGHEVHILAQDDPALRPGIDAMLAGVPGVERVRIELVPRDRGARTLAQPTFHARVAALLGPHSFVHLHGVWEPALHAAARAARRAGTPHALTPHGMLTPYSLGSSRWKKRVAMVLGARTTLRTAAFLHALSEDERAHLEDLRLGPPIRVIPNGIFLEELIPLPARGAFRAAHPELGTDPFVLFLGRLHPIKGLDHLADAFALLAPRMPGVRLVVAGPDEGFREPMLARLRAAGLESRAHLVGPIYGPDKRAALVDAAVFCLPSRHEGFSIAITEALACGLPVVISRESNFPEVERAGAGRVVPLDPAAIAGALEQTLRDPSGAEAMGRAGARLIAEHYTWPTIARSLAEAYEGGQAASLGA